MLTAQACMPYADIRPGDMRVASGLSWTGAAEFAQVVRQFTERINLTVYHTLPILCHSWLNGNAGLTHAPRRYVTLSALPCQAACKFANVTVSRTV